ncbi:diflavin flavoprotein [Geitlerinema sp. PCC 9228]|uniref:diflavin flavoprotein n=1 Tax=Geitlerinema sp. PCC 9228 TaxID=111611 RepID=UPI0008F98F45|nr:diflavin flavoprotein [Geitlerinema sp. PCC 9228]
MVATQQKAPSRLTMQTQEIAENTTAFRCLDWDRDRFDIEFGLQNGTTYNSFLIRGKSTALVDTSHQKFRDLYQKTLAGVIDPQELDYLIVSHTEPDHSGLVADLLEIAPEVTVVGAKVAIQFLENFVHRPFQKQVVKNGDRLDLGNGHVLEFVNAPNLHWPDTIFSYDRKTQILYTCDAFGMHYCSDRLYDENLAEIEADFRFYYDCLMGPNARSVLSAMKRMDKLGDIATVATGHGPLLRYHIGELTGRYRQWSQSKSKAQTSVAIFYTSDYGYGDRIVQALANGIGKTEVAVETVDLRHVDPQEVRELVGQASGIVIGVPPASGNGAENASAAINTIFATVNEKQLFGLFEPGGDRDVSVYPLRSKLEELGLTEGFPRIVLSQLPDEATYKLCEEAGTDLGQKLNGDRTIQSRKAIDSNLNKALGRISGGLYIITATKESVSSAMVASWVAQASFEPLGISIAVAKDRAIESLMQVGDRFVLNVLEEDNHQHLMRHFLKRFSPGADRFAGIKTTQAENGSPILADALAYLECEVVSRMECSDHWITYSQVTAGRVSNPDGMPAIHHRKVGSYY